MSSSLKNPLVLVVDDEPDIRELLEITLARMDVESRSAKSLKEAYALLKTHAFHLCLTDMRLADDNGLDLVTYIQKHHPKIPVAVITAHGNMESAIQALKSGAFDFISKPVDLKNLRILIKTALKLDETHATDDARLIGQTEVIDNVRKMIAKLARSQAPVYISGESGVGKELVARLIHEQGARASGKFVAVNCGAIPTELMESEFFGHVKGSFTGAVSNKDGLFVAAEGGTLFLDEVAELPLHMQVKLLRAIQEKTIRPVGSTDERTANARILSATHKNLDTLVAEGVFRQDLYYRLNVIALPIPPLREHAEDIPLFVERILQNHNDTNEYRYTLSKAALNALMAYDFPGNIRELENILERAVILCESKTIEVVDLHLPESKEISKNMDYTKGKTLDVLLSDVERQSILSALEKTRWNKTKAAKLLGISFKALRYRLQRLGLENSK